MNISFTARPDLADTSAKMSPFSSAKLLPSCREENSYFKYKILPVRAAGSLDLVKGFLLWKSKKGKGYKGRGSFYNIPHIKLCY